MAHYEKLDEVKADLHITPQSVLDYLMWAGVTREDWVSNTAADLAQSADLVTKERDKIAREYESFNKATRIVLIPQDCDHDEEGDPKPHDFQPFYEHQRSRPFTGASFETWEEAVDWAEGRGYEVVNKYGEWNV